MAHSLGAVAFSSMLRRAHALEFDLLREAYLQAIADKHFLPSGELKPFMGEPPAYEPFGEFDDPAGYAAYVPSSKWLSERYIDEIEAERSSMAQRASMLSLGIGAIDHSHKIPKLIARVEGEPVFTGLLTVTNEFGEIKQCALVPTKAHDQFLPALESMNTHLSLYGHDPPSLFYTDNPRGDTAVLRQAFPSLTRNTAPASDASPHAHLPPFTSLSLDAPVILSTLSAAHDTLGTILRESIEGELVGLDCEWNVQDTGRGGMERGGMTAIVQIAWRTQVFIVQLAVIYRTSRSLPVNLVNILLSSSIRKAGVSVKADMTLLLNDFRAIGTASVSPTATASGALELASLARIKGVEVRRVSLAALVASVLHRDLPKPADTRTSGLWEVDTLSSEQVQYAASDAAASLAVAQQLVALPLARGARLPREAVVPNVAVVVIGADDTRVFAEAVVICRGDEQLQPLPSDFQRSSHPNLTATRTLVRISRVLIPGALLSSLYVKHLPNDESPTVSLLASLSPPNACYLVVATSQLRAAGVMAPAFGGDDADTFVPELEEVEVGEGGAADDDEDSVAGERGARLDGLRVEPHEDAIDSAPVDPAAHAKAEELLDPLLDKLLTMAATSLPITRVLIDLWHLMDRIPVSKRHGCLAAFCRAFSAALFIPDATDKAVIEARLSRLGSSWDAEVAKNGDWVWARCRRTVPPPHQLVPQLVAVFKLYGPLQDAKTGRPLFNSDAWNAAARVIEDVLAGLVSDPPDVDLYSIIGPCRGRDGTLDDGVNLYRCSRGTNFIEGRVHRPLRRQFASSPVSVRLASARLIDFQTTHNLLVGTYNRTGQRYNTHFRTTLLDRIQFLTKLTSPLVPAAPLLDHWVNGSMYVTTSETYGVLPITAAAAANLFIDLSPSHPSFDPTRILHRPAQSSSPTSSVPPKGKAASPERHQQLAEYQGTRFAIVHVHTRAERELLSHLLTSPSIVSVTGKELRYLTLARRFNEVANGVEVFYKTSTHMQHYMSRLETLHNRKASLGRSALQRGALAAQLTARSRASALAEPSLRPQEPLKVLGGVKPVSSTVRRLMEEQPCLQAKNPSLPSRLRQVPSTAA
ncbi:hypothetical protein JCM10450v2_007760 [Rhodotorula kratochvilovae]